VGTTFLPDAAGLKLSFGRFGYPCHLEADSKTRVVMLRCDEAGSDETAGITINFYLPGLWASEPFTAETIAIMLRENAARNGQLEGAFKADDPAGNPNYYLLTSALYAESKQGQAFVVKVAPIADAVYSIFYTRMFTDPAADMRETARKWLAEHLTQCRRELGSFSPDPSWIPFIRSRVFEAGSNFGIREAG
jgi:hypothetical protein